MSVLKWLGYGTAGVVALLGCGLAYTAQTAYELPAPRPAVEPAPFAPQVPKRSGDRAVVLLVFDGLAASTVRAAQTPNLDRIAREGAHTLEMMPVFPTLSLPNHFSLSTGCYPEHHGVVSNHFLDPARGVFSERGDADWLLGCEPLHVVAERQGVRAAVFGHVGAISGARGKLASIAVRHGQPAADAETQIGRVIAQLERSAAERPGLITAYVTEPDHTAHRHGPTAPETLRAAQACDAQIGRTLAAIERLALRDQVTLLVTTDHGMIAADKLISVERLLRRADIEATVLAEGAVAHVYLEDARDKARALGALSQHAFVEVIDPEQPPSYARLGRSARLGDLVLAARAGYWMSDTALWPWYLRWASYLGSGVMRSDRVKGMHGYNPVAVPQMRAVFYAWGAGVAPGTRIARMRAVDVHPTVARLLAITPGAPVDGQPRVLGVADRNR